MPSTSHGSRITHHGDKFQALGETIQAAMSHLHIPGVALGLLLGNEVYTAGFGVNNLVHPLPVDAATLFQVGSITKTVTCTLLLRLMEAGLVELDVPLRTYLPDLKLADESVAAA